MLITILDLISKTATFLVLVGIFFYAMYGAFYIYEKARCIHIFFIPLSEIIFIILSVLIVINYFEISSPYK